MSRKKIISISPHIRTKVTMESTMYEVALALIPAIFMATMFYGKKVLFLVFLSVLTGILTEVLGSKLLNQENQAFDGSGIVTSLLFTLTLPVTIPYKVVIIGSFISIFVGKLLFGGVGKNIFNPALVGRAFVMVSFPQYVYNYSGVDGVAGASLFPLMKYLSDEKVYGYFGGYNNLIKNIVFGSKDIIRSMGETSGIAILIAAIFLIVRGHIKIRVPFFILGTLFLLYFISGQQALFFVMIGGALFASIFMATDMVTSPYTNIGLIIFSIFIGGITYFIRNFTSQPEGITYAILIMNMCVPTINKYTLPRSFGGKLNMKKIIAFLSLIIVIFILGFTILKLDKILGNNKINKEKLLKEKLVTDIFGKDFKLGEKKEIKTVDDYFFQPVYKNKEIKGYAIVFESKGYGKDLIKILLGINLDGKIQGLKILSENETLGLGAKIKNEDWEKLWKGRDATYKFDKNIDAYSGATYTFLNVYKTIMSVLESYEFMSLDDDLDTEEDDFSNDWDSDKNKNEKDNKIIAKADTKEKVDEEAGASDGNWGESDDSSNDLNKDEKKNTKEKIDKSKDSDDAEKLTDSDDEWIEESGDEQW